MRVLALAAVLAACRPETDYLEDMAVMLDLESTCAPGCDNCSAGQVCYGGALPSQAGFLSAVCLGTCHTTDDCPMGSRCVQEPSVYGIKGPVCMDDSVPARCPGSSVPACAAVPMCADAHTLSTEFFPSSHAVCGRELVHCPNGCDEATDAGAGARCR